MQPLRSAGVAGVVGTTQEDAEGTAPAHVAAARFLELALIFTFVAHGLAMLSMALLLLPGLPGGGQDAAARMAYVAAHPWLWRLGWLPWQLTALSDVLLALALACTRWMPRLPAALTLLVTLAAVIPDQVGQALWITRGVALAHSGDATAYAAFEARTFLWIAAWGGTLYTIGAYGWTWCFARAGTWNRALTWLSVAVWGLFTVVSVGPLLPEALRPPAALVAAGNAIGFVLLLAWVALVAELVLRRARPDAPHGRYAPWHAPRGPLAPALNLVANSRFVRALCEALPVVAEYSDIRDVVYINYVVPAEQLEPLVPAELELQRVGPGERFAFCSFLTFRHGHFGPALLGPLRRLLPSPVQTNWRIHVRDPRTGTQGVYFVSNAITSPPHALAARTLSEGMSMHLPRRGEVRRAKDGTLRIWLEAGGGSAPEAEAELRPLAERPASGPWSLAFASYEEMLAYCVPQDRALSTQPWYRHTTHQEIALGIPLAACEPLECSVVRSTTAWTLVGEAEPFAFRVARVRFRFLREFHDRWD